MLSVATDNIQTTTGDSTNHTGVSGTNLVATKIGEYTNGQSAAAAGATTSLWLLEATGAVSVGTAITISLSGAVVDKTCTAWKYTKGAGMALRLCPDFTPNPIVNAINASNGFGSAAFSGGTSKSRLFVRALGKEANSTTALTVSSGFTAMTAQRSRNNASAVLVRGEFRINTSTGETSNPTMAVSGDTAAVFAAIEEYDPRPAITVQPTNQSALEGGSAIFSYTDSGTVTGRQWQEQIPGESGAVYIEGSAQSFGAGGSITIPTGAQSAILMLNWWHGGGSTPGLSCVALPDLNTNRAFLNGDTGSPYRAGRLRTHTEVTATGAQTISLTGQTDVFNGPVGFIAFFDGPIEIIDQDYASVGDTGDVSLSLDTEAGAMVFILDNEMDTATPPSTPGGWTSLGTLSNNSMASRLRMLVASDSAGVTTGSDANYETLIGFSVRGGTAPTWENVSGETTDTLTLTGLELADSGRVFRGSSSNSFGTQYTSPATLTVTDGKLYLTALSTAPAESPTSTNTKNIAAPSGIQAGHRELLLVGVGATGGSTPVINDIAGWTTRPEWQSGPLSIGGGTFSLRLALFEREADGAGSTVVATATVAGYWGWHRTAWGNAHEDFIAGVSFDDLASTTTPVLPSMTPSKTNAVLLDWQVLGALASITEASGMTELSENTDHAIGLYMKQLLDTALVGSRTYGYSPAADAGFAVVELHSLVSVAPVVSVSSSLSAAVQSMRLASASLALPVRHSSQQSTALAAAVRVTRNAQADLSIVLRQARAATGLVEVAVRSMATRGASADLAVERMRIAGTSLNGAIQRVESALLGVDLQVQAPAEASASVALMVQTGRSAGVEMGLAVRAARGAMADLAFSVSLDRGADTSIDVPVQLMRNASLALDLAIRRERSVAVGLDLQVQDGSSMLASVQAAVQFFADAATALNLAVSRMASASVSLAAAVSMRRVVAQQIDVAVRRSHAVGVGLSMFVASDLMRFDGASWVEADVKRWNGDSWTLAGLQRWDGESWV